MVARKIGVEGIGRLEAEIMRTCWDICGRNSFVTVRDVYERLRSRKRIAYTTIMTVMRNLSKKGLLSVDTKNSAYLYRPGVTRRELTRHLVSVVNSNLAG